MATNTLGTAARKNARQVANTMVAVGNYNDNGISAGIKIGTLPQGARLTDIIGEVVTAFNAATTNVFTVGTNSPNYNNIVGSGDLDETAIGATRIDRAIGGAIARAADVDVYAKYTQTGTAATAGKAEVTLAYEGGYPN